MTKRLRLILVCVFQLLSNIYICLYCFVGVSFICEKNI